MKIHYFQRYHKEENVATANTMLLLSRLYAYSSNKFFRFLKAEFFSDTNLFEPEINFTLQEKSVCSVPDATISQEDFKIVVETKVSDSFSSDQLVRHLEAFKDKKNKVLMTLAPELMATDILSDFEARLKEYNATQKYKVVHINTTFESVANAVRSVIDDRDYEMQDVLEDFLDYCYKDGLIPKFDAWKYMRMQLAGTTFDFNTSENVYYDKAERGFRPHDYLGLYTNKSVRAIGKICAMITAVETEQGMEYNAESGELTEERKAAILLSVADGDKHGYDLRSIKHRYFFVEKFYATDFNKTTPRGSLGTRIFDLTQILGTDKIPPIDELAELLKTKSWQ